MNMNTLKITFLVLSTLLIAACATTPPTHFYTLSAEAPETPSDIAPDQRRIIGVGPIAVSPYLERNQIVKRTSATRLDVNDINHWAEPIETNISRIIATNLGRLMPDTQPIVRPWADADVEHHVLVNVTRFDADPAGNVLLEADWGIRLESRQRMPLIRHASITQATLGEDYAAITHAMSLALARLSEQIALELKKMVGRK